MPKRKREPKPMTERINCFNCSHCMYIGEGDYLCDVTQDVVISNWTPAEDFYACGGKDFDYER